MLQIAFSVALQKAANSNQGREGWEREKEGREEGKERKEGKGRDEGGHEVGRKGKGGKRGSFQMKCNV